LAQNKNTVSSQLGRKTPVFLNVHKFPQESRFLCSNFILLLAIFTISTSKSTKPQFREKTSVSTEKSSVPNSLRVQFLSGFAIFGGQNQTFRLIFDENHQKLSWLSVPDPPNASKEMVNGPPRNTFPR
jgi:hypothetical protein